MLLVAMISMMGGGMGGFTGGVSLWDCAAISSRLEQAGYDPLSSTGLITGGGGYALVNHLLMGGSGFGASYPKTSSDSATVSLGLGGGFFEMGYLLNPADWLWFYPMIGLGGVGFSMTMVPARGQQDFDSLLANPRYSARVGGSSFATNASFTTQFNIPLGTGTGSIIGVALRGQIIYAPGLGNWQIENRDILDAPGTSPLIPTLTGTLLIGGFGG